MSKIKQSTAQIDLKKGEKLMREYAQTVANKKALQDSIKNELDAYNQNIKSLEEQLLEIGKRNRSEFNDDGNLVFENGYLHVATNTVVSTSKKFDIGVFNEAHPELVDIKLKTAPVKKAFMNEESRKELIALGVTVDTDEVLQVIPNAPLK